MDAKKKLWLKKFPLRHELGETQRKRKKNRIKAVNEFKYIWKRGKNEDKTSKFYHKEPNLLISDEYIISNSYFFFVTNTTGNPLTLVMMGGL